MRRLQCAQDILARTDARIDEARGPQLFEGFAIQRKTLTLGIRRVWAADIGAFLPLKAKPFEVLNHRSYEFSFGAAAVEIFVAKDKRATSDLRTLLGNPECAGMSQVQEASGRWSEPPAV